MATGLLKSNAKQDLVISRVRWAVFPFMGTSSPLWAQLSFHMHIFSSRAHFPSHEHIVHFMGTFSFMNFGVMVASCPA